MTAPTLATPAAEVHRLRAELELACQQRDTLLHAPDSWPLAARRAACEAAYQGGLADGWRDGYLQAEADMAASWRAAVEPIAHPERGAARRIQAAMAGERRDQAEHERAFVARAYNTHDRDRTDAQRAAVLAYPPPGTRGAP